MNEIPPGPCSACTKQDVTTTCLRCRDAGFVVRYCNRSCQTGDWRAHKQYCGKKKAPPGAPPTTGPPVDENKVPVDENKMPADEKPMHANKKKSTKKPTPMPINPRVDEIKIGSPWWAGLSKERQRERFVMSYQFRAEEAYVFRGEKYGMFAKGKDAAHSDFRKYHRAAEKNGMLPDSCKGKFVQSAYAKKRCGMRLEKKDVMEKFGVKAKEHMVLRDMAEKILSSLS